MEKYVDIIKALRRKAEDQASTEAEVMEAIAQAEKLMAKHQITEEQLEKITATEGMRQGSHDNRLKTRHPINKYCITVISAFCEVKGWWDPNDMKAKFYGFEADVEMAEYLISMIRGCMERTWKQYLKDNPIPTRSRHTEFWSFHLGFSNRVRLRMTDIIEARIPVIMSSGTDLVVKKLEIVEKGFQTALGFRLKMGKKSNIRMQSGAFGQGQKAGDKVNFNRPVEGKGSVRRIA